MGVLESSVKMQDIHHGDKQRQTTFHTLIYTYGQVRVTNCLWRWQEAGVPGENYFHIKR